MGTVEMWLRRWFYAFQEHLPLVHILRAKILVYESMAQRVADEMAHKQLEIERLKVLLDAERANKPRVERVIKPKTAAEMRRMVEHVNAEEMEQEAV